MKILAIRISNLASLEGVTDIDFTREPLCSAGIFAITGPTGAGKSTILDALCLALYSRTPRYRQAKETGIGIHDIQGSTISQGDVRGILRDGTGEGFAEVDFVGTDNRQYRATWSVKRARGKAEGQIQADTLVLMNLTTGTVFPGKKLETQKEIERVVGLNFEQFTRSVLLAQGDFTAFLKANKDEKASLLEKLTGMHVYSEISRLTFEKHKLAEQELRELNLQMSGIVTLTEDGIRSLQEERTKLGAEAGTLEKQILALGTELNWHQRLTELQSGLEQAEAAWAEATDQKNNAAARQMQLRRIEQVQQTRTWTDAIRQSKELQLRKTAEQEAASHTLSHILQEKEQLKSRLEEAEAGLSQKLQTRTEALPLIEEAKTLDTLIREKEAQTTAASEEAREAGTKHMTHLLQLQSKKEEFNRLSAEINRLQSWKDENSARRPVAENHDLILSGLSDARQQLETMEACSGELAETEEKAGKTRQEMQTLEMQAAAKEKEAKEIRKQWEAQKQELSGTSIMDIQRCKSETDSATEEAIAAQVHWQMLFSALKESDALEKKLDVNRHDIVRKEDLVNQTAEQRSAVKIRKETSAKLLEKARMQAAENVEALRSHLVTGEACPVCGSTEHPFAGQNPALGKVMQGLEQEHRENEKVYERSIREHSTAQEAHENLRKTIAQQEAEQDLRRGRILELQQSWDRFPVSRECAAITHEQKADWLEERIRSLRSEQSELLQKIRHFNTSAQRLEILAGQAEQHGNTLTDMTNKIKDMRREILSSSEKAGLLQQQKEKASDTLAVIEQSLSAYFPNADWISNYRKDPRLFISRIGNFARQWDENMAKLEQSIQQQKILSATLSGMESQLNAFNLDLEKRSANLSGLEKHHRELTAKRKTIFEGKPANIIEAELQQAVDSARQDLADLQKAWQDLNTRHTQTSTQNDQLQKDLAGIEENITTFSDRMRDWLSGYNGRNGDQMEIREIEVLLGFSQAWIEAERASLKSLDDKLTKAHSILSERKELWDQHRLHRVSDNTEERIRAQLDTTRSALNDITRSANEAGFRLQQDRDNRKKAGRLQAIIESKAAAAENWSRLNEMIGSADGKKFRQIAQEYTLDVLLDYANIHLNMLTERYLLQRIPGSLGLQVTDRDMGDEVRTVYSLSGGESFLVSLALALGLASLSSSRMQVESLFIDEGFGSLDPATLNIAMDALERLYNQGRKVGVISHVQEMTERIPTRIMVSKLASGRSKVEISGS